MCARVCFLPSSFCVCCVCGGGDERAGCDAVKVPPAAQSAARGRLCCPGRAQEGPRGRGERLRVCLLCVRVCEALRQLKGTGGRMRLGQAVSSLWQRKHVSVCTCVCVRACVRVCVRVCVCVMKGQKQRERERLLSRRSTFSSSSPSLSLSVSRCLSPVTLSVSSDCT